MPKYTDEQIARANSISIEDMLRRQGEPLKRDGRDYRWTRHDGVLVCGNKWYDHIRETGGKAISFIQRFENLSFKDAMQKLLSGEQGNQYVVAKQIPRKIKPFILPDRHTDMRRVFAYLINQRCIDADVISHFAHAKTLYEDSEHHNAVFVGLDENSTPKHAHKKSTLSFGKNYRGNVEGSDVRFTFNHKGASDTLYAFEAPIDMLSFISLYKTDWQNDNYIALNGVSAKPLLHFLLQNKDVKNVCLCLDNDEAGMMATAKITAMLVEQRYDVNSLVPQHKDWNDDLVETQQSQTEMAMQNM